MIGWHVFRLILHPPLNAGKNHQQSSIIHFNGLAKGLACHQLPHDGGLNWVRLAKCGLSGDFWPLVLLYFPHEDVHCISGRCLERESRNEQNNRLSDFNYVLSFRFFLFFLLRLDICRDVLSRLL